MKRREYLAGIAGIGTLGAAARPTDAQVLTGTLAVGDDSFHPGEPRFMQVGERLVDIPGAGQSGADHLGPRVPGEKQRDAENYSSEDFTWSILTAPADSDTEIQYTVGDNPPRYDAGKDNVAEFVPDAPGTYVLAVEAPDGTHELTVEVFESIPGDAGGPPTLTLDGSYDGDGGTYVIETDIDMGTNSGTTIEDTSVHVLADDRDALSTDDVTVDDGTITVPQSAVTEDSRLHAVAYDGAVLSTKDTVELNADGSVDHPNRPPEWLYDAVMYQIFPRSFNGLPRRSANFSNIADRVDYLEELDVDLLWLTPVVPAESSNWKRRNSINDNDFTYVGGGPHGYDANSYFDVAADLGSAVPFEEYRDDEQRLQDARDNALAEYKQFVQACHERGIKVCFDFVINHGGRHHPFYQDTIASKGSVPSSSDAKYRTVESWNRGSKYFDWFDRVAGPNTLDDGTEVEPEPGATFFAGFLPLPEWNYSNVALREHILAAADFWSDEVGVDGFRCDIAYGVPHDFWKEVREVVRANDSEFLLLDETIPYQRSFAENEFDLHYDKTRLRDGAVAVAQGNLPFQELVRRKRQRDLVGLPDHSLLLNFTENHDEQRMLKLAQNGSRSNPAAAQRAVWAACVALPGVPSIYYGQERQITNYGTNRYDYDGTGQDPRDGDIGPGKYKRAFMNWDEYPEDHLQFYKDVVATYRDTEVLKPGYDLVEPYHVKDEADAEDVLVFGRKGDPDMNDAVVVCHVGEGTTEVDLLPSVDTTDQFTGNDIQSGTSGAAQTVEVDTFAVLETPSLYDIGEELTSLSEPTGDDDGPGTYTYPEGYADGVFDITSFSAHDGGDSYQFRTTVGGPLTNPDGLSEGFSAQHLQFYLRDPSQEGGVTEGRAGTNVTFTDGYQYRVVADGANGVRVEDADGTQIATGSVQTNAVESAIVVEFPKSALASGLLDHEVSVLMCGYDAGADGNVMQVEADAGTDAFGGAENDNAPNVIDLVAPRGVPQQSLLDYDSELAATLQYVPLRTPFTEVRPPVEDPTGDNRGPGGYEMARAGDFYDGAMDVTRFRVLENRSLLRFEFEMTALENPFGLTDGFSHEFLQIYVRDTAASDDIPTGTNGRQGTNVTFADPYHYRVLAKGENKFPDSVEDPEQGVVTNDVAVSAEGTTITVDVPKSAVSESGDAGDLAVAPLVCPYDGYGQTGRDNTYLRPFGSTAGDYTIGASNSDTAPRVMDMVVGEEAPSQSEQLSYGTSERATVEYVPLGGGPTSEVVSVTDPESDNDGAGNLEFPSSSDFYPGAWDLRQFTVEENSTRTVFRFTMSDVRNPFELPRGWSHEYFQIYVRDPDAGKDTPADISCAPGVTANTENPHHYRILANGETVLRVERANGARVTRDIETSVDGSTVTIDVPRSAIGGGVRDKELAVLVCPFDGLTENYLRAFADEAGEFEIGAPTDAPKIMDLIAPAGTTQTDVLTSSGFGALELPLATPSSLGSDAGDGPEVIDSPATDPDGDSKYEDVNGDGQTDLFDALDYYNNGDSDAVQNNVDAFDFDGDGDAGDLFDALELWNRIS